MTRSALIAALVAGAALWMLVGLACLLISMPYTLTDRYGMRWASYDRAALQAHVRARNLGIAARWDADIVRPMPPR